MQFALIAPLKQFNVLSIPLFIQSCLLIVAGLEPAVFGLHQYYYLEVRRLIH